MERPLELLNLNETTTMQQSFTEETPNEGPSLPTDLLVLISQLLLQRRHKRTLLELMLTCHASYEIGIPILLRNLSVTPGDGFSSSRIRAFLGDVVGTGKFRHVRRLTLGPEATWDSDISSLLTKTLPFNVLRVELISPFQFMVKTLLDSLPMSSGALRELGLALFRDSDRAFEPLKMFPESVKRVDLFLEPDRPFPELLRVLAASESLTEWHLRSQFDDILEFYSHERLISTLKTARVDGTVAGEFFRINGLKLRDLELTGLHRFEQDRIWAPLGAIDTLERLAMWRLEDKQLVNLGSLPDSLKKITVWNPVPVMTKELYPAVRQAFEVLSRREVEVRMSAAAVVWGREEFKESRELMRSLESLAGFQWNELPHVLKDVSWFSDD